ncbi:MAG: tetratricopeptide repeat protein, partial [Myxococcota bacterium]
AVVREGRRHLDRKDAADARESADLAVALAPDLASPHWLRARALLAEDPRQIGQATGAALTAVKVGLTALPGRRALLANLCALAIMGLLAAGTFFLLLQVARTIRQYVHDFHHLFPRGAARLQTAVLAVALLLAPILLQAGVAVVIAVFTAAAWFHSGVKERIILGLTLAMISASPYMAGFVCDLSAFWGTPAEDVWRLESADGGGEIADRLQTRADGGDASWVELFALARHHKREGRLEQAAELYGRAAEEAPREAAVQNNLGVVLYAMGDLEGARGAFRRATELAPAFGEAWHNLSKVYFRLGENVPGQEARRRAVDIDETLLERYPDPEDRLNLALAEAKLRPGQILSLARSTGGAGDKAKEQVRIRLSGLVPAQIAQLTPVALIPVLLLAGLLVSRRRPAAPCVKCGRSVCPRCDPEVAGGMLCAQCLNVFQKRGAVSQRARLIKEAKIRRHQSWKEGLVRTIGFVLPGGGQVLAGKPVLGFVFLSVFAMGCLWLLLWFGPLPPAWPQSAASPVLRLVPPALLVVAAWAAGNWLLWRRDR